MRFTLSAIVITVLLLLPLSSAKLSCSVSDSCSGAEIFRMSNTTNAHAELSNQSNYNYIVCCSDDKASVNGSCDGEGYVNTILRLSNITNAHAELITQENYQYDVCINTSIIYECEYKANSCADTNYNYSCIASVSSYETGRTTSLHVGNCSAYTTKICCGEKLTTPDLPGRSLYEVSFSMEFNISGSSNDEAEIDSLGVGTYDSTDIDYYYACLKDESLSDTPTFGLVFSGNELNYMQLSSGDSYEMKVNQYNEGNRFIIPVTTGGCGVIRNKMPIIKDRGLLTQPFVSSDEAGMHPAELTLSYPDVDIVGDFSKSGQFVLIFEKAEDQIIVRSI